MGPLQCSLDEPATWETGSLGSGTALEVPDFMTWTSNGLPGPVSSSVSTVLRMAAPSRPQDGGENQMTWDTRVCPGTSPGTMLTDQRCFR